MKTNKFILYFVFVISVSIVSCLEKNENPRKKKSVFHCTINGQYWESDSIQTVRAGFCHIQDESMEEYSYFIINAYKKTGSNLQMVSLSIYLKANSSKISYSAISSPEKLEENISIDYFEDGSYEQWYHSKISVEGTNRIIIDNYDEKNQILSGIFEANVYLVKGNETNMILQDGYFENIILPLKKEQ